MSTGGQSSSLPEPTEHGVPGRIRDRRSGARAPSQRPGCRALMSARLPAPRLTHVYRLEATLGQPVDLGDIAQGHRRIVPLTGGTFTGPEISGKLLPGYETYLVE